MAKSQLQNKRQTAHSKKYKHNFDKRTSCIDIKKENYKRKKHKRWKIFTY